MEAEAGAEAEEAAEAEPAAESAGLLILSRRVPRDSTHPTCPLLPCRARILWRIWRSLPDFRSRGRRSPLESAPINITPREKRREKQCGHCATRSQRP